MIKASLTCLSAALFFFGSWTGLLWHGQSILIIYISEIYLQILIDRQIDIPLVFFFPPAGTNCEPLCCFPHVFFVLCGSLAAFGQVRQRPLYIYNTQCFSLFRNTRLGVLLPAVLLDQVSQVSRCVVCWISCQFALFCLVLFFGNTQIPRPAGSFCTGVVINFVINHPFKPVQPYPLLLSFLLLFRSPIVFFTYTHNPDNF